MARYSFSDCLKMAYQVNWRIDDVIGGRARMIAVEDRVNKIAIDRATFGFDELRQFLATLFKSRTTLTGPDKGIQRQTRNSFGMGLGKFRVASFNIATRLTDHFEIADNGVKSHPTGHEFGTARAFDVLEDVGAGPKNVFEE